MEWVAAATVIAALVAVATWARSGVNNSTKGLRTEIMGHIEEMKEDIHRLEDHSRYHQEEIGKIGVVLPKLEQTLEQLNQTMQDVKTELARREKGQ